MVRVRWWPVILLELMWNDPWWRSLLHLLFVVITYRKVSVWLWKSLENSGNFFSPTLWPPCVVYSFQQLDRYIFWMCVSSYVITVDIIVAVISLYSMVTGSILVVAAVWSSVNEAYCNICWLLSTVHHRRRHGIKSGYAACDCARPEGPIAGRDSWGAPSPPARGSGGAL